MQPRRWLITLILAAALLLPTARAVQAHASPTRAEPGIETVVPTAPAQLRVWFSEELASQGGSLEVVDATGARVDAGDARVDLNDPDRKLMVVSLNPLSDGVYTVNWKSVSRDDGHEASGSFRFGVGANTQLPTAGGGAVVPRLSIANAVIDGNTLRLQVTADNVTIRQPPAAPDHAAMGHGDAEGMAHDHMGGGDPSDGGPYGHLHVYLNGVDVLHAYSPEFTLDGLTSGSHHLRIELMNEQHGAWSPVVETAMTVLVP